MADTFFDRVHKNDSHTPDVLSCLSNLSNDEVFTPPEIVNQMLDMLPQELFSDPNTKFFDPACKTGVFLREIAKRLLIGLEPIYPDLQERIDHIFHEQLYGIAITELTSLLSRRSVYCSRYPNGKYSVTKFDDAEGNIRFKKIKHTWENGQCKYCGASKDQYDRNTSLETYAYEFIHLKNLEEIKKMKFDVIISNPPYHLSTDGHYSKAIYNNFIETAINLNPRYISMIVPSRWFSGGLGLDQFRNKMLKDERLSEIHDFPDAGDCFPGVEIKGGVNYFLWEQKHTGDCKIVTHKKGKIISEAIRPLLEKNAETFIRNNLFIPVLHKVQQKSEVSFSSIVSSYDPFGFDIREANSNYRQRVPISKVAVKDYYKLYYNGWRKEGLGYVDGKNIRKGQDFIDKYKVLIPKAWGVGDPENDWLNPIIADPGYVCTETYLVVGPFETKQEAINCVSYIQTRFFHLMVSFLKITQNTMQKAYSFVPIQNFNEQWTDEKLFNKYQLNNIEIENIINSIKPTITLEDN